MLNKFLKSALILFILTVLLTGCVFSAKEYSVEITFTVDGAVYLKKVFNRSDFEFPENPSKQGFIFSGWYLDKEFKEEFVGLGSLNNGVAAAVLYAKFRCLHENIINEKLTEATCVDDGEIKGECSLCRETVVTEVLPASGHKEKIDVAVAPSCVEGGLTEGRRCKRCGEIFVEQAYRLPLGHKFGEGKIIKEHSCTQTGVTAFYCERENCGFYYEEIIAPHNIGEWEIIDEPTCVKQGERIKKCVDCGEITERETIGFSEHYLTVISFDGNVHFCVCDVCGEKFEEGHKLDGSDNCVDCPYYKRDLPPEGSAVTSLGRRKPLSSDFKNIAGNDKGILEVVALDIAQGDCIFIKFPDGQTMVMDAGSVNFPVGNHYDRLEAVLKSYNVKKLNYLFITHSDYDHVRYIRELLKDYEVENIYMPKISDDSNGKTWKDTVKDIIKEQYIDESGAVKNAVLRYNIGDYEIGGENWRMRCYSYLSKDYPSVSGSSVYSPTSPDAEADEIINSLSPVCLLEYAGRTVVFTGDSNRLNESYLVRRGVFKDLDADVLKVAHHGSKTSTTAEFLSAIKCEYAIISYGTNVFGHPTDEVIMRLNEHGYKYIYGTKEDGNIRIIVRGTGELSIDAEKTDSKDFTESKLNLFAARLKSACAIPVKRREETFTYFAA